MFTDVMPVGLAMVFSFLWGVALYAGNEAQEGELVPLFIMPFVVIGGSGLLIMADLDQWSHIPHLLLYGYTFYMAVADIKKSDNRYGVFGYVLLLISVIGVASQIINAFFIT